jgi:flagellar FliL protein
MSAKKAKTEEKSADKTEGDASAAPAKKKLSGKKMVLFIVLPALLVLGGGGGAAAYFLGFIGKKHDAEAEAAKPPPPKPTLFVDLPEMLVNLNTGSRTQSYLKLKVALELDDPAVPPKLDQVMPRVLDSFQVYLRELRSDDLGGSAGLYRVKEELLLRVTAAVQPLAVKDVLFKEMLVQ